MNFTLIFDPAMLKRRTKRFEQAQDWLDKECVKRMTPFVPVGLPRFHHSGKLAASVKIAEPGVIVYEAPFARHDYYAEVDHSHGGNPRAQRLWFEVVKAEELEYLRKGVAEVISK